MATISSRLLRRVICQGCGLSRPSWQVGHKLVLARAFHPSRRRDILKPFLLTDIGEGTRECQIIQWFVQPGARVEQFDKICEVQSDKTASDITSPFDGVIRKLHYEADDMALVGKPLVDIEIQSEISSEEASKLGDTGDIETAQNESSAPQAAERATTNTAPAPDMNISEDSEPREDVSKMSRKETERRALATPAVRHLTRQHNIDLIDIEGTGKDGRVLKEDVHRHIASQEQPQQSSVGQEEVAQDRKTPLTPVQSAMYKTMSRSLTIPHFLYTSTVDMTFLTQIREKLNKNRAPDERLTPLPFIMKAVSLAFAKHPFMNATLDTSNPAKPELTQRGSHNFGIAVDTPRGLIVPVVRDVQTETVNSLARKIRQLSKDARDNKLAPQDMKGATFSVTNIGSVGGGVVAPIIVEPQIAIVGVGRSKVVPAFDEAGNIVRKEELVMSWSADHRVVDGASCARAAESVRSYLEGIEHWILEMR